MKFCEVSRNSISNRYWKFQLSILKNKKVLFLKKYFLSRTAKIDPKDGVSRPNFQWWFWSSKVNRQNLWRCNTNLFLFLEFLGVNEFEVNKKNYTKFLDAYGCLGVLRINEGIYLLILKFNSIWTINVVFGKDPTNLMF